ncbi:NusB antitermination factor [Salsuginibacillus halophilus]|uniref:Transcription antitermination protein NusB n=1 Tax=Salsuginibacillus halophilus TaxID=517424 RepID=A0A2P8HAF0_9BACI|nr:transcription antitermination factor NusB [Salsuginibacillus halophilus]PSL43196.1 NusB antitermination factor [Salsuginibacillus halophilus]
MNRRVARLRAVQALFQLDLIETSAVEEAVNSVLEEDETADEYLYDLVRGVEKEQASIDAKLGKHLDNWALDRLGTVDRAVMRTSVYEMMHREDVPLHVSVNEAIELAKAFGGTESGKFVNGALSSVMQEIER